jgi:hypothetical protein
METSHDVDIERTAHRGANHLESLIDEAGEESFPASDPPAVHPERPQTATNGTTSDDRCAGLIS